MTKTLLLTLGALTTAAVLPQNAKAGGDEALAAVGGFIGGVIVGAHLDRPHYHRPPPVVVVEDCPPPVVIHRRDRPHGYWTVETVRVWIPERWTYREDRWGRRIRVCEPGHYEYRRERVWVEAPGPRRRW